MYKILFVCTGNICRSPTVEGVFRNKLMQENMDNQIEIDSAGTQSFHVGEAPDRRSIKAAAKRGIDIKDQRARQLTIADYQNYDLILGLDNSHIRSIKQLAPKNYKSEILLFLQYTNLPNKEVPDPYYGGGDGFEQVLDMAEAGSDALLAKLRDIRDAG